MSSTNLLVRKSVSKTRSSTDISLLVDGASSEEFSDWDRSKISKALQVEAGVATSLADEIAEIVETRIFNSGLKRVDTVLIRSLVNNELFERGLTKRLKQQEVIGMPKHDLMQLIFHKNNENSNVKSSSPESVALDINDVIFKRFALDNVFSQAVTDAHLRGRIYLHDLGYPLRVYCSGHSLEYIKKYGLELENLDTISGPAKHARTLTGHLNTFIASMQAFYAGALGLSYLNIFYAPYFVGMSYKEILQEAQYLIYSCAQNSFSRGGQVVFTDFNIHAGVPSYLRDVPAIGPGGHYTGKTYKDYELEVQMFARALLEVWRHGDIHGRPFAFPKNNFHCDDETFSNPSHYDIFKLAAQTASENGGTYFVFDRGSMSVSMCCRLKTQVTDMNMIEHPETMRFAGIQNITINLPQAAYRAGGDIIKLNDEIEGAMRLAFKGHYEKKEFIQSLMKPGLPAWQIGKNAKDGKPYVDLNKSTYIIGILGLNECIKRCLGQELHESDAALFAGLKVIAYMRQLCEAEGKKSGLKFSLEESPAESATRRLAKIDLHYYPEAKDYVQGSIEGDSVYYTNSVHLRADAQVDLITRIKKQSKFHTLIDAGAIIHAFVGAHRPSAESIIKLLKMTYTTTNAAQLTISPEFTICKACARLSDGLPVAHNDKCPKCGSTEVDGISRIVGYFSRISNWNKSKREGELVARHKGNYAVDA